MPREVFSFPEENFDSDPNRLSDDERNDLDRAALGSLLCCICGIADGDNVTGQSAFKVCLLKRGEVAVLCP